jgi:hypothetical protein
MGRDMMKAGPSRTAPPPEFKLQLKEKIQLRRTSIELK